MKPRIKIIFGVRGLVKFESMGIVEGAVKRIVMWGYTHFTPKYDSEVFFEKAAEYCKYKSNKTNRLSS